jgi:hypothetical protein
MRLRVIAANNASAWIGGLRKASAGPAPLINGFLEYFFRIYGKMILLSVQNYPVLAAVFL